MAKCLEKYRDIKLHKFISFLENPTVHFLIFFLVVGQMGNVFKVHSVRFHL